jgi:hypothetical protein
VFIKVDGTSFTEMFAANDWKPFQSCYSNSASTVILRLEHLCIELMAKHIKDMVEKEPFKALVLGPPKCWPYAHVCIKANIGGK